MGRQLPPVIHGLRNAAEYRQHPQFRRVSSSGSTNPGKGRSFGGANVHIPMWYWQSIQRGAFLGEKDATGKGYAANRWRTNPTILAMSIPAASIEALQKRGATFIICNNALTIFSGMVAQARGLDAKTVLNDMKANILPGVTTVPDMVIAIEQAQNAGIRYYRQ